MCNMEQDGRVDAISDPDISIEQSAQYFGNLCDEYKQGLLEAGDVADIIGKMGEPEDDGGSIEQDDEVGIDNAFLDHQRDPASRQSDQAAQDKSFRGRDRIRQKNGRKSPGKTDGRDENVHRIPFHPQPE